MSDLKEAHAEQIAKNQLLKKHDKGWGSDE